MKTLRTIQRQIRDLERISQNEAFSREVRDQAYEAYHALRWVIEDVDWTPAQLIGGRDWREVDALSDERSVTHGDVHRAQWHPVLR